MKQKIILGLIFCQLLYSCSQDTTQSEEKAQTKAAPAAKKPLSIPYSEIKDLSGFKPTGDNWQEVGGVKANYTEKHHIEIQEGTGIIVNTNDQEKNKHLLTDWEHGDLELDIEFLIPKGSNSGLYFMGRYEIQLLDSWGVKKMKYSDCGSVYQRWDTSRPKGQEGYEGTPANVNASKAPGLWQHFNILFRAPRFDENGNKIANAKFERVIHNGTLIHENVEVTGPTRAARFGDEKPTGPLLIQGDHGPVAFRNIRYKKYHQQELKLTDLTYDYYEGEFRKVPHFDTLTPVKSAKAEGFYPQKHTNSKNYFAIDYQGTVEVPVTGDYIFHIKADEGAMFYIDDSLVVDNNGPHGYRTRSGSIKLTKGSHSLRLGFMQYKWVMGLSVKVEGPGIPLQYFYSEKIDDHNIPPHPMVINPENEPRMQRGFMEVNGNKHTHVIAVGHPENLHYAIDLQDASILHVWRGDFADVAGMWHSRGHSQLMATAGPGVALGNTPDLAQYEGDDWPSASQIEYKAYQLNENRQPVFEYMLEGKVITDHLMPADQKLTRMLSAPGLDDLWVRIAAGTNIEPISEGVYRIDGNYYIECSSSDIKQMSEGDLQQLMIPVSPKAEYSLIW
ncbi:family 16 glycoside hydrolase [Marinoscillum furvescens]|nr:family 16 glycoside hydrolase [Marinoscillum furvescens]